MRGDLLLFLGARKCVDATLGAKPIRREQGVNAKGRRVDEEKFHFQGLTPLDSSRA
jgi:hypothetical protein